MLPAAGRLDCRGPQGGKANLAGRTPAPIRPVAAVIPMDALERRAEATCASRTTKEVWSIWIAALRDAGLSTSMYDALPTGLG